jgi:hypothetical protein
LAGRGSGKKGWWLTSVVKPVREELQTLLALYDTWRNDWRSRFLAGDERPMQTVIERHASRGNSRMVLVLKSMATHENCNALGQCLGVPKSTVFYLRRMAHMELNCAYARALERASVLSMTRNCSSIWDNPLKSGSRKLPLLFLLAQDVGHNRQSRWAITLIKSIEQFALFWLQGVAEFTAGIVS